MNPSNSPTPERIMKFGWACAPETSGWLREAGFMNLRPIDVPAVSPLILPTKPQ